MPLNEPNYQLTRNGKTLCWQERATGACVSPFEPTFLLRASDPLAVEALAYYKSQLPMENNGDLHRTIRDQIEQFNGFAKSHPSLVQPGLASRYMIAGKPDVEKTPGLYTSTGIVSDEEPLFLLRGSDPHAAAVLAYYVGMATSKQSQDAADHARETIGSFQDFRARHPDMMREPGANPGLETEGPRA